MTHTTDPALHSTVQQIVADCQQFRILVMGKTGCGKSSLINKVFGVDHAKVSHKVPGVADINHGYCDKNNVHFILHDSQGFEPGEADNLNIVKRFIEDRSRMTDPKDRLHAIWICTTTPFAGDRIVETGVENIVKMDRGDVPIVVVFTKYDGLVNSEIFEAGDESAGKKKADEVFQALCAHAVEKTFGKVPALRVSIKKKYEHTIAHLVEVTDKEVQRSLHDESHAKPASLAWAIAQRGSSDTNIKASIDVGRKRYWTGLLASTDFTGRRLEQCLGVIHDDIVAIWNIHDPNNYLSSNDFKAKISVLVDDLVTNPRTSTSGDGLSLTTVTGLATAASSLPGLVVAAIGTVIVFAKWGLNVYQNTPGNVACIMGYVVDLTIVMYRLFQGAASHNSESIISALSDFAKSGEAAQVHHDICKFSHSMNQVGLDKDNVLNEIVRLINLHCVNLG